MCKPCLIYSNSFSAQDTNTLSTPSLPSFLIVNVSCNSLDIWSHPETKRRGTWASTIMNSKKARQARAHCHHVPTGTIVHTYQSGQYTPNCQSVGFRTWLPWHIRRVCSDISCHAGELLAHICHTGSRIIKPGIFKLNKWSRTVGWQAWFYFRGKVS